MHILIASATTIPVATYGGTERVVWSLGKELSKRGYKVTFLVNPGSTCPFAKVVFIDPAKDIKQQVPDDVDVVHFFFAVTDFHQKPYICTIQTNPDANVTMDENTAFVSANQASRFGSDVYVHNGIDLDDYSLPNFSKKRTHIHFLAKAAWRLKNVKGAINVATRAHEKLIVMGGTRLNLKMGFRFTPNLNVRFKGMVGNEVKSTLMNASKGLIFPVLWHEPFGIAIIESLYFGCPVFGTPYGSLAELIPGEYGVLSNSESTLAEAVQNGGRFNNRLCHEYAADNFNMGKITSEYLKLYEKVLNGQKLSAKPPRVDTAPQPKFLPWYK